MKNCLIRSILLIALAAPCFLLAPPAAADTATIQPSSTDTYLRQDSATTEYGTDNDMRVRSRSGSRNWRSLVQFSLSAIPSGSVITSATLELRMTAAPSATRTYNVHRVTRSWSEANANWNVANTGVNWTTAGGDFVVAATDSTTTGTVSNVWLSWDVTTLVQAWYAGSASNYGIIVKDSAEDSGTSYTATFATREYATTTYRPQLTVTYTPPDLQISSMTVDPSVVSGDTVTVTMTVLNNGASDVTDVTPSALTASGSASSSLASGPTPATAALLAPGESASFTWTYTMTGSSGQTYAFTGNATANGGAISSPSVATNTGSIGNYSVTVSPLSVVAGSAAVQLSFTVTNGLTWGTVDRVTINSPNTTVWDTTATWDDNDTSGWIPSAPDGTDGPRYRFDDDPAISDDIPAAGGSKTFTVTFALIGNPGSDTTYTFPVDVRRRGGGTTTVNALVTVKVPKLQVTSIAVDSSVVSGGTVTVVMTVMNIGSVPLTDITPSALTTGGTATKTLTSGPTPPSVASLESDASTTFEWVYTITGSVGQTYSFTGNASANGGSVVATSVTSNTGAIASYGVTVSPSSVTAGSANVQLAFTVTNNLTSGTLDRVTVTNPNTSIWQSNGTWGNNDGSGWTQALLSGPTRYQFTSPAAGSDILANGGTKTFTVTFTLVADPGSDTDYTFPVAVRRRGGATTNLTVTVSVTKYVLTLKSVSPATIDADGVSTSRVTVTLTKGGIGQSGQTINFTTNAGTFTAGGTSTAANTDASGDAYADLRSSVSSTDVTATVNASFLSSASTSGTVNFRGVVLSISATPTSITADGVTSSTVTATLTSGGSPLSGRTVSFSASAGNLSSGSAVTNGSGQASVTLTSTASKTNVSATVTGSYAALTPQQTTVTFTGITIPEVGYLSGNAGNGGVTLNWANPSQYFTGLLIIRRSGAAPTGTPSDGTSYSVGNPVGDATVAYNGVSTSLTQSGLTNGTGYYYKAYVYYASARLYSGGTSLDLSPSAGGAGEPEWSYGLAGGSLMNGATPDYSGNLYQSAGTTRLVGVTQSGGDQLWAPVTAQGVLTGGVTWVPVSGSGFATNYLLAGDQTGRLYAVNAASGGDVWAPVSLPGAEAIEAAPVVQLGGYSNAAFEAQYGATTDVVFAVSKNTSTTNNRVYAVRLSDGALLWQFNQTGTYQMDGSLGGAWIDYGRNRLYVVTRAGAGGGQASLWSLDSLTGAFVGSLSLGHIEAAPMQSYLDETTLYLGTTGGNLEAIDVSGGAPARKWTGPAALGSAIVNASLWEDYTLTGRLYLTTQDGFVWALDDPGAGPPPNPASPVWKTAIAGASAPMVMDETTLYVGSSDGKLYELGLTDGVVTKQVTVGNGTAAVGTPSASSATTLYVGTSTGKLFRYALPLP